MGTLSLVRQGRFRHSLHLKESRRGILWQHVDRSKNDGKFQAIGVRASWHRTGGRALKPNHFLILSYSGVLQAVNLPMNTVPTCGPNHPLDTFWLFWKCPWHGGSGNNSAPRSRQHGSTWWSTWMELSENASSTTGFLRHIQDKMIGFAWCAWGWLVAKLTSPVASNNADWKSPAIRVGQSSREIFT